MRITACFTSFHIMCVTTSALDILMFYIKYLTICKVQMHAGAIRKLFCGLCICTGDNRLAKARGISYRTNHTITYTCKMCSVLYI